MGPVNVVIFIIDGRAFGDAGGCCGIQRGAVVNLGHFGRAAYGHRVAGVDVDTAIAADNEGHVAEVRRCVLKHIGSQAHVGAFGNGGCADARFEVVADVMEAIRCVIGGDVVEGGALHAVQIVAGNGVLFAIVGEVVSVAGNISDDGAVKSGNRQSAGCFGEFIIGRRRLLVQCVGECVGGGTDYGLRSGESRDNAFALHKTDGRVIVQQVGTGDNQCGFSVGQCCSVVSLAQVGGSDVQYARVDLQSAIHNCEGHIVEVAVGV